MQQPEAKFKAKLIKLHRQAAGAQAWYTYLSPGGPGQKQGVPDLVFGDPVHGIVWVEAKIGSGLPQLRPLQRRTLTALAAANAKVIVPSLADDGVVHLWQISASGPLRTRRVALGAELWPAIWMVVS